MICDNAQFLQALLPEKRFLYFQGLAKAAGSDALAARIRDLQPHLHIFGHTHFSWDAVIDGRVGQLSFSAPDSTSTISNRQLQIGPPLSVTPCQTTCTSWADAVG